MPFGPIAAAYLRSFLPGRDAHFVVVPRLKLVYGRVPKVANTAIRSVLAGHVDLVEGTELPSNRDRFWQGEGALDGKLVSAAAVRERYADHLVFTVVRDPFDRLVSCWSDMIAAPKIFLPNLARLGFAPGMDFATFVDRVVRIPDRAADLHFRSQASLVTARGTLVPTIVGRFESLPADWARVRAEVARRSGTDLGDLPEKNVRRRDRSDVRRLFDDPRLVARVRARYADDFRLFYPSRSDPEPVARAP
jgi:dermatan 4-sulfotransferase 1